MAGRSRRTDGLDGRPDPNCTYALGRWTRRLDPTPSAVGHTPGTVDHARAPQARLDPRARTNVSGRMYVLIMSTFTTSAGTDPVTEAPASLTQVRTVLDALAGGHWWQASERDLLDVLAVAGRVRHELARVEVHATAEVLNRGMSTARGMSAVDYLTRAQGRDAPAPPVGHALMTVRLAEALNDQGSPPGLGTGPDATDQSASEEVAEGAADALSAGEHEQDGAPAGLVHTLSAFEAGMIGPSRVASIIRFHNEVEHHSPPDALAEAMDVINTGATDTHTVRGKRLDALSSDADPQDVVRQHGWTDRELGVVLSRSRRIIKPAKEQEIEERRGRSFRSLYALPRGEMTEYRLVVEPEAAAIMEAAIAALSAPAKDEEGRLDARSPAQRRADALLTVVQRGVSAPTGVPQTAKAQVMVTIPWSELLAATNGAGITATGQVLSPNVVRRMACDGSIIPVVLGSKGEILDMGREKRLFTPGQHRALWHRDKMCTFPGCTIPPQWCDAHHLAHWVDGGPTDLDNGALLCQRHHTYVHNHELTATVTPTGVTWHT